MNDAFIAMQHREELADTLFFAGLNNQCTKELVRGKKAYVFKNDKFCLTITGRSIRIDDVTYRSTRDAKRHICERYL
jgi:hypothetical protein